MPPRLTLLPALAALAILGLLGSPAGAVGTRTFSLDELDDLRGGDLSGVSVDASGTVRAGWNLGALPLADASSVWSSVVLPDGGVLVGTGNEGKVYRVAGGQAALHASTGEIAVSALALGWGGEVLAGTLPGGRVLRLGAGGTPKPLVDLPDGTEHVWALAFDAKRDALYAATGPEGKLFRIDRAGRAQVHYDSDEPHLVSLAVAEDGSVYAGSSGKGLLYRVTAPGRAAVVHDFEEDDVRAVALARGGVVYAIANKYAESFAPPRKAKGGPPAPVQNKPQKAGKGVLVRFSPAGVPEEMMRDADTHYVTLALGEDGAPYVGTGVEGRVYTVNDHHHVRLVADTPERQVGVIVASGRQRFVVTSDPVVFREVRGEGGADAVWTSKVLDAGLRATFGRLTWRSSGPVELSTRSGNTAIPDATWSAWSAPMGSPAEVTSPAARYVQVRARFNRDPGAALSQIVLAFVTDNARPVVTSIEVTPKSAARPAKAPLVASGGEPPAPSAIQKIAWKVDNPDLDQLRFRLAFRLEGQTQWRPIGKPGEKITKSEYEWDTNGLPEGLYRVRVEASDEDANPPDRAQRHALESRTLLIDNTPPVFRALSLTGRRLRGEVLDGLGPISRIEVAVGGQNDWRPLFPTDSVFDEPAEAFDADVGAIVPAGSHIVAVRAYDAAGNSVSRELDAR